MYRRIGQSFAHTSAQSSLNDAVGMLFTRPRGHDTSQLRPSVLINSSRIRDGCWIGWRDTRPIWSVICDNKLRPVLIITEDCDTFLSTDAGLTWNMVQEGAHKYEFGDQGSILVIADDEELTDHVHYSYDGGKTWSVTSHASSRSALLTVYQEQAGLGCDSQNAPTHDHSRFYQSEVRVSSSLRGVRRSD